MRNLYDEFPFLDPEYSSSVPVESGMAEEDCTILMDYIATADVELKMLYLLAGLDQYIPPEEGISAYCKTGCFNGQPFLSLSDACDTYSGKLIPRFSPTWKKGTGLTLLEMKEDPLSVMRNYIWVKNTDVKAWEINNVYIPKVSYDGTRPYKIVCSPLIDVPPFRCDFKKEADGVNYFYVDDCFPQTRQAILDRANAVIDAAAEQHADIVLFPELAAAPGTQQMLQRRIRENWYQQYPKLVFLPSSEYQTNEGWVNQTLAIDDGGKELFRYNKQHAFVYSKPEEHEGKKTRVRYFEPIRQDRKLTILHCRGIGRIGVCICADIFEAELMENLLKHCEINLLLVLAYTSGYDRFDRSLAKAMDGVCDVVVCNCCGAYHEAKQDKKKTNRTHPAIVYYPYGHANNTKQTVSCCSFEEGQSCSGCMGVIDIGGTYRKKVKPIEFIDLQMAPPPECRT